MTSGAAHGASGQGVARTSGDASAAARGVNPSRRLAALVAVACLAGIATASADDWRTLDVPAAGFGVEMPGDPQHRDNLKDPELFASVDDYGMAMGDGFLMVSVFAFQPEKRALLSEEDIFGLGEAMVPAGCAVTTSRPLPGGPGAVVEADFACAGDVTLRYRMHLSGDRLYRLAAGGPRGVAEGDAADRFFRSFALLD